MDQLSRRSARPRRRTAGREGFTLLEVVIAMGVLAVGLLGVAAAQIHAMHGGRSGRHETDAAQFAHTRIEQFQRMNFTELVATAGFVPVPAQQLQTTVQSNPVNQVEENYTIQWRITDVTPNALKSIDVRVNWNEPNRPNRSVTISTVLHNDPRTSS